MKKLFIVLCAVTLIFSMVGSAMATLFTLDSYTVNYRSSDPGLVLYVNDILDKPASADYTAGNSYNFNLFEVGTNESTVNWRDDLRAYDISVNFDFSSPDDMNQTVSGQSDGHWRLFRDDFGTVEWDNPATFTFGDGGLFTIALSDVAFGTPGSAIVQARLNFISDSGSVDPAAAPVPEPATILLMGAGLLGIFGYSRKRFSQKS